MAILVFTLNKISILVGCGVKHIQFSYFLRSTLTIRPSFFYILCYIDLLTRFYFTPHYYFVGSSTIQRYKLIRHLCNPGGIIIRMILLFYLASCFLILRCIRDPACYNMIIWYKVSISNGLIKMDTHNVWWNLGFS